LHKKTLAHIFEFNWAVIW